MSIEALLSHADGSDEVIDEERLGSRIGDDELLWIDLIAPDQRELETLRRQLGLTDAAAEALTEEPGHARARVLEDGVEVVVVAVDVEHDDEPDPFQILVGDRFVITRHATRLAFLDEHRERIQDQREVGRLTPAEFLAELLNWQLDTFVAGTDLLERAVDRLDEAALGSERDLLKRLVAMRRRIAGFRRLLLPHRDVYVELARPDFLPERHSSAAGEFQRLVERFERASEGFSHAREMLIGTFDVHMTRTAQRTNDVMRVLTIASVVLLPSAVIAGVMGMNFKVPFFDNPVFFWVVIGAMLGLAVTTILVARWRRWL
ncbi:MAG: CorA family divalent cation transporter [Chloroflexota bacterium]